MFYSSSTKRLVVRVCNSDSCKLFYSSVRSSTVHCSSLQHEQLKYNQSQRRLLKIKGQSLKWERHINNQNERVSSTLGPDRVLPSNSSTTSWPDGAVQLRTDHHHEMANLPSKSIWTVFQETVERVPNRTALAVKRNDIWVKWTYTEYFEDVKTVAKAFIKLGLKRSHAVGIIGFNAPEWHISNVASVIAGGLATGIYTTNSPEAVNYVLEHSRANILMVENEEQLNKVTDSRDRLEHLRTVIQWSGEPSSPGVLSWKQLIEIGKSVDDSVLQQRLEQQAVNQACMLVYTSGTTGDPKGVMISQDNLTWIVEVCQDMYRWNWDSEHAVSYLPLSHVAAQVIDIYLILYGGATVWFADNKALQGSLINTLREVRPTRFFGVPRVWEKFQEKIMEIGRQNKGIKKSVAEWAKAAAFHHHQERMAGREGNSLNYRLARWLVLSRIHAALGLDRAAHPENGGFYSSSAPVSIQTLHYFMSLDMPVMELLGQSETGGPLTACLKGSGMRPGSVGKAYPHFEVKLHNPDENGVGEIITRGRHGFLGYLWDEEKTKEVVDEEGWIHSGDLGRVDQDGFVYVCGRIKEIIITGGGENIAPVPIEDDIKSELIDVVSHVMVVGDQMKHLSVILTLKTVLNSDLQPTDILAPEVKEWLSELGCQADTTKEVILKDSESVRKAVLEAINKTNTRAVSNASKVRKFMFSPTDFSLTGGELTPTMKIKRKVVLEKYKKEIEEMYQFETQSSVW